MRIDQTLTQDATGTLVMLELEALDLWRVRTQLSVQYVDHNLLQTDFRNADDHLFLYSAARRFGLWYSRPGNGVSHPIHMARFGIPGSSLVGSDSHTPAAGALGMLALGAGGLDVAFVMSGEPLFLRMPEVLGVRLTGRLPDWVSAKDVVLEMLRRYDVKGCRGRIIEYHGPGLDGLSAMDRHVIANMGTEMGATTTVFPSDREVRRFLTREGRGDDWREIAADRGAEYDQTDEIDLSRLEPLIARPGSPGDVVAVREIEGEPVHQVVIGSSANPGLRDFWVVGEIVKGRSVKPHLSFDVNPTSRADAETLAAMGAFTALIRAGARFHQAGCMGCIGMGQAPATGKASLRTMPRNFPGRSGTLDDRVFLCSPETAAASALTGVITDPRDLRRIHGLPYPRFRHPRRSFDNSAMLVPPPADGERPELEKGPNIRSLPDLQPLPDRFHGPVLLKLGDNISTDEILQAGAEALAFRSNIPELSRWAFVALDETFPARALEARERFGGHVIVAGENYAQGSSREHAALVPRYLGQVAVLARSYARIGWQNLVNFGILPLEFCDPADYDRINPGDEISMDNVVIDVRDGEEILVRNESREAEYRVKHGLSERQVRIMLSGGAINYLKQKGRDRQA